jgi:hypothetical protein
MGGRESLKKTSYTVNIFVDGRVILKLSTKEYDGRS